MKQTKQIFCPHCQSGDLVKNGHSENGTQCFRCKICEKSFQTAYSYNAWKLGIKEKIDDQTLNSSGVRDVSHNLDIQKNTVITHLTKPLWIENP